jgi:hypothetical protein
MIFMTLWDFFICNIPSNCGFAIVDLTMDNGRRPRIRTGSQDGLLPPHFYYVEGHKAKFEDTGKAGMI